MTTYNDRYGPSQIPEVEELRLKIAAEFPAEKGIWTRSLEVFSELLGKYCAGEPRHYLHEAIESAHEAARDEKPNPKHRYVYSTLRHMVVDSIAVETGRHPRDVYGDVRKRLTRRALFGMS